MYLWTITLRCLIWHWTCSKEFIVTAFDHKNYLGEVWTSGVDNVSSGQTKGQMVVKDRRADRDTDHWRANGGEGPNNVLEKWFNSVINDYIFFS